MGESGPVRVMEKKWRKRRQPTHRPCLTEDCSADQAFQFSKKLWGNQRKHRCLECSLKKRQARDRASARGANVNEEFEREKDNTYVFNVLKQLIEHRVHVAEHYAAQSKADDDAVNR